MPTTEIILTDNVPGLGAEADIVKVRRGYARNYLLPRGKAHEVTPASLRQLENLKKKRAEREARELNEAEELARRINKLRVTFKLETGETGKAFGSITAQDIVTRLKNEIGEEIDRHKIHLEHPIKTTGEHEVTIKLHHDVTVNFKFEVKSALEERPNRRKQPNRGNRLRNEDYSENVNKWRALRERILRSLVRQREMALAEARRSRVAEEFFRTRQQVPHRIFTAPRLTASKPSRACSVRC